MKVLILSKMLFCTFVFLISFGLHEVYGQVCYIQNQNNKNLDMTGFELNNSQLAELETVSCALRDALPTEDRINFKIFDFGLYKHNNNMEGGYEAAWANALTIAGTSPYYLVFGRMDENKNFKVAFRLPDDGYFSCQNADKIKNLEALVESMANENPNSLGDYFTSEILVINYLKEVFDGWKDCCLGNRNPTCTPCEDLKSIKARLKKEGFREMPCKFISNENLPGRPGTRNATIEGEANIIIELNELETNLRTDLLSQFVQLEEIGISTSYGFIADNNYFCENETTTFIETYNSFNANTSQFKVMYVVVNDPASDYDFLYEKVIGVDYMSEKIGDKILAKCELLLPPGYSGCHGTNRFVPPTHFQGKGGDYDNNRKDIGILAHSIIQTYYKYVLYGSVSDKVYVEYAIPGSTLLGNTGYADIVNKSTKEIWEIKSSSGVTLHGIPEVARYVLNYNKHCKVTTEFPYFNGRAFPIKLSLPWFGKKTLVAYNSEKAPLGGVIEYYINNGNTNNPKPQPINAPELEWKKFADLIDLMLKAPVAANVIVNQYLIDNPEMKPTLILLSTLAIAGCIWGTGASLGTAAAATIPAFIAAKVILETAIDYQPTGTTGGA